MLVSNLSDRELDVMLKRLQVCVRVQFGIWVGKTITNKNSEEIFNNVEEIIYKTQMADEILTGMTTFRNSIYITEGDYEAIMINLIDVMEMGENILEHMYESFKENPDFSIVDRDILVEAAFDKYADVLTP